MLICLRKYTWLPAFLVAVIVLAGYAASGVEDVQAGINDYPSAYGVDVYNCNGQPLCSLQNSPLDSLVDVWGFYNRECTSFAAWRMTRDGHPMSNNMNGGHFGDAWNWYSNALAIGLTTSTSPQVGWVEQSTSIGHVAYTEKTGPPPTIEDYNSDYHGFYGEYQWFPSDHEFINFTTDDSPFAPAVLTNDGFNTADVFARGMDGQLNHSWGEGTLSSTSMLNWEHLPIAGSGTMLSNPAATTYSGQLDIFLRDTSDQIIETWYSSSVGWQTIVIPNGGLSKETPAVTVYSSVVYLFVGGTDDNLWWTYYDGSWHYWQPVSGAPQVSSNLAISLGQSRVNVFYRSGSTEYTVYGTYSAWSVASLSGSMAANPSAVSDGGSNIWLVENQTNGSLYYDQWNGSAWSGWLAMNGAAHTSTDPALTIVGGSPVAAVTGTDNRVYASYWSGGGWILLGTNTLSGGPAIGSTDASDVYVFARGNNAGVSGTTNLMYAQQVINKVGQGWWQVPDARNYYFS